jgi:hypothetical protein
MPQSNGHQQRQMSIASNTPLIKLLLDELVELHDRGCCPVEGIGIAFFSDHPPNKEEDGVEAFAYCLWDFLDVEQQHPVDVTS